MIELYLGTLQVEVLEVLADEDHGIVLTGERGEHAAKAVEHAGIHRWDSRDGKCARFENYYDDAYTSSGRVLRPDEAPKLLGASSERATRKGRRVRIDVRARSATTCPGSDPPLLPASETGRLHTCYTGPAGG
jgi:hypothetical protein